MSKGKKILILVVLLIGSIMAFRSSQEVNLPGVTAFFAFANVGLFIAITAVALWPDRAHRR